MTLTDLFRLIRRYWPVVVLATVLCGGAGFAYAKAGSSSSHLATANIVGNSQVGAVSGYANAEARTLMGSQGEDGPYAGYTLEAKAESNTQTVAVTASGPEEEVCVQLANSVAEAAFEKAQDAYGNWENPYAGYVDPATAGEKASSRSAKKFILVGALAGLFLGLCIVIVVDLVRRPVKSVEGVQDAVGLPVLEKLPAKDGERLLANVRFASKLDELASVLVVPAGEGGGAEEACELLRAARAAEGEGRLEARAVEPLLAGMGAAYESKKADAVIVVARQWADSLPALESTVAELQLAGANLVGLVFAEGK